MCSCKAEMAIGRDWWFVPAGIIIFNGYYFLLRDFLVRLLFTPWMKPRKDEVANGVRSETVVANGEPKYTNGFSNGTVNAETLQSCRVEIADSTVAEIANWVVSGSLGFVTSLASVVIMWQAWHDPNGDSWLLVPFVQVAVWYFLYDIYFMYDVVDRKYKCQSLMGKLKMFYKKRLAFIIHHIVVLATLYKMSMDRSYRSGLDDFYVGAFMAREFTNPFTAIASTLKLLNRKDSPLYVASGLILIVLFFFMRILSTPFLIIMCAVQYHSWNVLATLYRFGFYFGLVLLTEFAMQVYWFFGIFDVVVKVICPGKKKA